MAPNALVPTTQAVLPTPAYEFLFSLLVCGILWQLGKRHRPIGWMTGVYLMLSAIGRFLVEFIRINPRLYWGLSNAQVAAIGSGFAGLVLLLWSIRTNKQWAPKLASDPGT